jgi:dihydrofolate reductase
VLFQDHNCEFSQLVVVHGKTRLTGKTQSIRSALRLAASHYSIAESVIVTLEEHYMTQLSLIVAMDENRLIGNANQLPWKLPADLAFFKRTTMGKPIIMGRKTYESIGRPLPGRRNIVITRDPKFSAEGCEVVNAIDEALTRCSDHEELMLIGGATLYEQTIEQVSCMYITRIYHCFSGDTWFPEFDSAQWTIADQQDFDADESNPFSYSFVKYVQEL